MIVLACHDLAERVRWKGQPIGSLKRLCEIITELDAYKVAHGNRSDAVVDRTIQRTFHNAGSWLDRGSRKRDGKAGERTRQLVTEQIGNQIALIGILFFQKNEKTQT